MSGAEGGRTPRRMRRPGGARDGGRSRRVLRRGRAGPGEGGASQPRLPGVRRRRSGQFRRGARSGRGDPVGRARPRARSAIHGRRMPERDTDPTEDAGNRRQDRRDGGHPSGARCRPDADARSGPGGDRRRGGGRGGGPTRPDGGWRRRPPAGGHAPPPVPGLAAASRGRASRPGWTLGVSVRSPCPRRGAAAGRRCGAASPADGLAVGGRIGDRVGASLGAGSPVRRGRPARTAPGQAGRGVASPWRRASGRGGCGR
jgi:hypothetical protein